MRAAFPNSGYAGASGKRPVLRTRGPTAASRAALIAQMSLGISRRGRAVDMFGPLAEDLDISGIGQCVDGKHPSYSFGEAQVAYLRRLAHRIPNIGTHLVGAEVEAVLKGRIATSSLRLQDT